MQKKIHKIFFVSEKIPSDNVAINCLFLRREYLSLAVNGLINSLKIFHITNRDFFYLNCIHSDQ